MKSQYILLFSAIIAIFLSAIISIIPIGSFNQGQVSALYPSLFTPATYTFSIWSVIYLSWLILWIISATWKIQVSKESSYVLAAAQILSSLWLIPSQYLWIWASLLVMLWVIYLLSLLFFIARKENIIFQIVSELFLGWILIACIANIHLTLISYSLYFFPVILTSISIAIWLFINSYLIHTYAVYTPWLVAIWSFIGIYIWQDNNIVQILSIFSAIALILMLSHMFFKKYSYIYK